MRDFAFYNAGCEPRRGLRGLLVPIRRLLRRLLRPIFLRQAELLEEIARRQERLEAFFCDATALARRLAVLEDRLEELLARQEAAAAPAGPAPVISFPKSA